MNKSQILSILLSVALLAGLSTSASASDIRVAPTVLTPSEATLNEPIMYLSDMSELECLNFIKNAGVEIPDDYEDETQWAPFVKDTIAQVEADPDCFFAYSYRVTLEFALAIQKVVNEYYSVNPEVLNMNFINSAMVESE